MRRIALTLVSVIALTAPALASGAAAPATPAPAPAAPATSTPATGAATPAQPGAAVFGDVGKTVAVNTIPALQNILVAGSEVRYMGDEHGMKAYFVTNAGQGQVVYITPDGQASIIGGMFSGDGTPISVMQLARMRQAGFDPVPFLSNNGTPGAAAATTPGAATPPAAAASSTAAPQAAATTPALSPGEQLLNEVNRASWLAFGANTGRALTVFMDPNCGYCHTFFKNLQAHVNQNKIYLRVVPVSTVGGDASRSDMLNILSSADPQAAWTAKINGQPVPPAAQLNPEAEVSLSKNNTIFTRWQLPVTPYSIYRTSSGEIKVLSGEPSNMNTFLAELGITP